MIIKKIHKIQSCHNCNLCLNQPPLLDSMKKAHVFWVGLSAVHVSDISKDIPLSSNTNTGRLLTMVEMKNKHCNYYKTNLVKCLPLEENKIRYPKQNEMESCYENLDLEIKKVRPKIIFLLGRAVSDFILKMEKIIKPILDDNFNYRYHKINNIYYIPIHHPSYILVYKRKFIDKYINRISELLRDLTPLELGGKLVS